MFVTGLLATTLQLTAVQQAITTSRAYVGTANDIHVRPPRLAGTATIDGVLDEPQWRSAALLTGFSQFSPQDGVPAADSTHVLVWYSPDALYVGIQAFESHGAVHATLADRDKISADDNVQIFLGTFHDQRQVYVFGVNPFGVQMDGIIQETGQSLTGSWTPTLSGRVAPDLSQDFVFASRGRLTAYGYDVEIRIPFKSLRFQSSAEQSWDINVVRRVQHSGFEDSWTPARRSNASFLAQSGTLDALGGFDAGGTFDVNPIVTQKSAGAPGPGGWSYGTARPQLGGNLRWGLKRNLALSGTVRPDFAEVESDAGQFAIDPRVALFFPEKRPFFLDGLDLFATPHTLIYTRRIARPEEAAKLAGKVGHTRVGLLAAQDDPFFSPSGRDRTAYEIVRAVQDVGASRIGMAYTDRVVGSDYNRVADVDGRIILNDVYTASFQAAKSFDVASGRRREAPLWEGIFARNGKRFGLRYALTGISEDFRAGSGFVSRTGIAHGAVDHRATWFGARGAALESLTGDILFDDTWQYANFMHRGDAQDKKFHVSTSAGLRGGWALGAGVYWETFGFDRGLYAGYRVLAPTGDTLPFTGTPRIPNRDYVVTLATPQWTRFTANLLYVGGQDENFFEWAQANINYLSLALNVRPTDRGRVDASLAYEDFRRRTDHTVAGRNLIPRVKVEYQLTRSTFVRLVGEYDLAEHDDLRDETRTFFPLAIGGVRANAVRSHSLHGEYLFSYQPTPGTVLFIGYGSQAVGNPDASQRFQLQPLVRSSDYFLLKYSYLFRT